eukprot:CAMPEP_0174267342 /NCGR_PEP_ID=MMETSP0439-20130205/33279_1 /TAXON_ID=0 /ORGANISM="Stereomyxa ramosa, Strain Chinc5" /LENGTH=365 /DNA_ID=CAMNT_0015354781 /DNA_START=520 /DNA_END=1617 /DNA_ORIENTATION=+
MLRKKIDSLYRIVLQQDGNTESLLKDFGNILEKEGKMMKESPAERRKKEEEAMRKMLGKKQIRCTNTLTAHEDTVEALVADDKYVYSASWDNTIKLWDTRTMQGVHTLTCNSDVRELLIDDNYLYSGCGAGTIQVWDLEKLQCTQVVRKHNDDVLTLQMCEGRLFSGSSDSTIRVWDVGKDPPFEDDNTNEFSEGEEKEPFLKNQRAPTLTCLDTLTGHNNWVFALAYCSPYVFSGSSDHTIKVWSAATLKCVSTLNGHSDQVRALSVANGNLFSGSYDCSIKVWDINTLKCIQTLNVYNEVFGLGTTAGYLFSGDENGTIKVWDLRTRRCVHTLSDHSGSVYAFTGSNGLLLSASSDTTIKVWQ